MQAGNPPQNQDDLMAHIMRESQAYHTNRKTAMGTMSYRKLHFKWSVSPRDISYRKKVQSIVGEKKFLRVKNEVPKLMAHA